MSAVYPVPSGPFSTSTNGPFLLCSIGSSWKEYLVAGTVFVITFVEVLSEQRRYQKVM